MLSQLKFDSKVLSIIDLLKLKVTSTDDYSLEKRTTANDILMMIFASGLYHCYSDKIVINPMSSDVNHTLLHELVHWTGHPTRLNRHSLRISYKNGYDLSNGLKPCATESRESLHFEEYLAESGAIMLHKHFDLPGFPRAAYNGNIYLSQHTPIIGSIDYTEEARAGAKLAVDYILNLLGRKA